MLNGRKWVAEILLISCACLFLGKSTQHIFLNIPIRAVLWDQDLMERFITWISGLTWEEYVSDPVVDRSIQWVVKALGGFYLACAAVCIYILFQAQRWAPKILWAGAIGLFLLSLLYFIEKFFRLGELLEYTAQWMSPIILYLFLRQNVKNTAVDLLLRITVALTFGGHGLYAIGFYPIPGNFIDMMIMTLGVEEDTAVQMLFLAGWIDLAVAALLFIPYTHRYAALYAFAWGLLTAMARITAYFNPEFPREMFVQWIPEFLYRMPHALLPLALFFFDPEDSFLSGKKSKHNAPANQLHR